MIVCRKTLKVMGLESEGFTLIELLVVVIILAVLTAVVVPQFSSTAIDAKEATLHSTLKNLRSVISMYHQQHNNVFPGATSANIDNGLCTGNVGRGVAKNAVSFESQLMLYSNVQGHTCDTKSVDFPFGPYIKSRLFPSNPITNSKRVTMQTKGALKLKAGEFHDGWKFDIYSGRIIANDSRYEHF